MASVSLLSINDQNKHFLFSFSMKILHSKLIPMIHWNIKTLYGIITHKNTYSKHRFFFLQSVKIYFLAKFPLSFLYYSINIIFSKKNLTCAVPVNFLDMDMAFENFNRYAYKYLRSL